MARHLHLWRDFVRHLLSSRGIIGAVDRAVVGDTCKAWATCTEHADLQGAKDARGRQARHHTFYITLTQKISLADDPEWEACVYERGTCAGATARVVRGQTVRQRLTAQRIAHLTPSQGLASLLADGTDRRDLPGLRTVEAARRRLKAVRAKRRGDAKAHCSPTVLRLVVEARNSSNSGVHYRALQTEGVAATVFILEEEVRAIRKWVDEGGSLIWSEDATYKMNCSGWCLSTIACPALHLTGGLWRTTELSLGHAWTPKESAAFCGDIKEAILGIYEERGLDLRRHVQAAFYDNSPAQRAAHRAQLQGVPYRRDLRHQVAACRRRKGPLSRGLSAWAQKSAFYPPLVFDLAAQALLDRLRVKEEYDWMSYLTDVAFSKQGQLWSAEWQCCIAVARPGFTPASVGQSKESQWAALKRCTGNLANTDLATAAPEVELALRALMHERNTQAGGDLVATLRSAPDRPAHQLLSGSSRPASRAEDSMGHQQWAKSAWQFAQRAPWNFHRIDQELMDFDRHYVMWKYEPSHQVDQKTAEAFAAFMRAETKPEILCAAKKLHIVKDDGSVSLAMLEEIVQELVLVSRPRTKRVQQEDCWGLPYLCSCSTFACRGQCEHDLFVQWIEGTGAVEFHSLQDFTRTDKVIKCMPQPAGRPCDAPGAWETIQAVQQKRDKARAKAAQKKRKARAAQSAAEDAIWTPRKAAKTEEADKTVAGMLAGLTHAAFMRHYEALIKVGKAKMPLGEALASGVAKAVHALHGDA
ncbi:unnamed protein product, partial [Effrenium voratum]